jgi:glyoxylase-like metal-dependent hydrolase (beta-lactamase superfamily II)
MKLGELEVRSLCYGMFKLDGGAMFGVVPQVIWKKTNPPDDKNRIEMSLRGLLIEGHGKKILIDAGTGFEWSEKVKDIYAIRTSAEIVDNELARLNVKRSDITDVIITHLHFDHVGGCLFFPNAKVHVHEKNQHHAHAPTAKDKASFWEHTISPLEKSGRLVLHSNEAEIIPGVSTWVTHGHTPGQQLVKITSGKETIFFCGDTISLSSQLHLPFVTSFDLYPMTTMQEKEIILNRALKENWILAFCHDPNIVGCRVKSLEGKFIPGETVDF